MLLKALVKGTIVVTPAPRFRDRTVQFRDIHLMPAAEIIHKPRMHGKKNI
jgi:hypothetical protein